MAVKIGHRAGGNPPRHRRWSERCSGHPAACEPYGCIRLEPGSQIPQSRTSGEKQHACGAEQAQLRHLANCPRGRYKLGCTVTFHHRRDAWLDRATASRAVRYDIVHDPVRGRWYLDASWSTTKTVPPTPNELAADGLRLLGVDLNHGHLAAVVIDPHGNPVGRPMTVATNLTGPTATRDGRLRTAISHLIVLARQPGDREPGL